jgi:hypothetical protein
MYYTTASTITKQSGKTLVRATNGALKARQLYPGDKTVFDLEFEMSSRTDLDNHYAGDRDNSFSYTDTAPGGGTYTVVYTGPPQYQWQPGGWWRARVKFEEV